MKRCCKCSASCVLLQKRGSPASCARREASAAALASTREEGIQVMCGGERRGGGETGLFPQFFYSLGFSFIFPASSPALSSHLFPLLSPLSSPLPDSPSHYTTFTAAATFGSSPLQPFTAPPHGSPACGSFPSSVSCHSPVIIRNSENERENIGACSPLEPVAYTSYSLVASCWAALRGLCQALGGCPLGVVTKDTVAGYSSVQQSWICVPLGFLYQLGT